MPAPANPKTKNLEMCLAKHLHCRLGYTPHELVGERKLADLVFSRSYTEHKPAIWAPIVESEISEIELLRKDGSVFDTNLAECGGAE
jgi:hypothetical protein